MIQRLSMILSVALFAANAVNSTERDKEATIINGHAADAKRCFEITEDECRRERMELHKRGCISDWALKELETKEGPDKKVQGGFPYCTSQGVLKHWCYCGCFHPDTRLLAFDKEQQATRYVSARDIFDETRRYELVVLAEGAGFERLSFSTTQIEKRTHSPEKAALVVIHFQTGAELKLSSQHAVLLADGRMVVAEDLKTGEMLLGEDGKPVGINDVTREHTTEEVINFLTVGKSLRSHMLIAEGVIVGDLAWQNDLVAALDRVVMDR